MTIPYAVRLICMSLAAFSVVLVASGLLVSLFAGVALRASSKMRAASAAAFVLALRLLPTALAGIVVALVCVPSYILFEQRSEQERAGFVCFSLASISLSMLSFSAGRTLMIWRRSAKTSPVLALVGLFKPRIVVSEPARELLTPSQLDVALRHEEAHAQAGDNVKRLLILLAPAPFPGFANLEQHWKRFAEWAADDRAVSGDPNRSLTLATALVRVARIETPGEPSPLMTSFLAGMCDLETRVNRLLDPAGKHQRSGRSLLAIPAVIAAACIAAALQPAAVHDVLERLMR